MSAALSSSGNAEAAGADLDEAQKLRIELDEQLLRVRSMTFQQQIQYSVDDQLSDLALLISQYSTEALEQALVMTIGATSPLDPSYTGRYPLHLACDTNAPVEVIRFFLQHEPTRQAVRHKDKWEDLPIHTACSRKDYTEVVKLLLEYDETKETIFTPRYDGSLPIHTACRYNAPPQVIEMLLESDTTKERKTLFVDSMYGQVPLHVACRCNLHPNSLRVLLHYDVDKKTVLLQDSADRLPLHVAYLNCPKPSSENAREQSSIELLLQTMIHGRMERVGLLNWKHDMHTFLERLSVPERDFDASDKLEMTCEALKTLLERAILLELAIWKASCCVHHGEDDEVGLRSMEMSVKGLSDEFKRERRIKSGAEMIIPGVLSFLEDEPIMMLLEQMGYKE